MLFPACIGPIRTMSEIILQLSFVPLLEAFSGTLRSGITGVLSGGRPVMLVLIEASVGRLCNCCWAAHRVSVRECYCVGLIAPR